MTSAAYAAGPVGYLLVGPLVDWVGVRPAFLVLAGALLAIAVLSVALPSIHLLDGSPVYPPAPSLKPHEGSVPLGEQWLAAATERTTPPDDPADIRP
jgi:MFS family permease